MRSRGLFFRIERNDGQYRPKNLFLRDPHVVARIGEQRRRHKTTLTIKRRPAGSNRGPVLARDIEIRHHLVDVNFVDERADFGGGVERVADLDVVDTFREAGDELVVDRVLHQQAAEDVQRSPLSE